jgi:argininosuccinate synthase
MSPRSRYLALSPEGTGVEIPKELFIALSDFLETRKYAGEISIEFRNGQIVSVEAVSKKCYR